MREPKKPWIQWAKRTWSAVTTVDSIRSIGGWLLGAGSGAAAVVKVDASAHYAAFPVERWAAIIAAFCFGAIAALLLWNLIWRLGPLYVRWYRRKFGEAPFLSVRPCGGRVAVLEIENSGGRCSLTAWGRIVKVDGGSFKKQDSYPMLWRMDWQVGYVAAPRGAIARRNGPTLKMSIGEQDTVPMPAMETVESILAIDGGPGRVDALHYNPRFGSPIVTVEIRIEAEPPLSVPFRRMYTARIHADYQHEIELMEVTP